MMAYRPPLRPVRLCAALSLFAAPAALAERPSSTDMPDLTDDAALRADLVPNNHPTVPVVK